MCQDNEPTAEKSPGEDGSLLAAAVAGWEEAAAKSLPRAILLGRLRQEIQKLERRGPTLESGAVERPSKARSRPAGSEPGGWHLGSHEADELLPQGLECDALHEVKPANFTQNGAAGGWMAAFGFALRLACRRFVGLLDEQPSQRPWGLWCWTEAMANELGRPSVAGLARLGVAPSRLLIVETTRASEALIALEEALRSRSLALVGGALPEVALTPARRLSLAALSGRTPCLLVTHPKAAPAASCATRWRTARLPSAPHPFDARAPGSVRFAVSLERCRGNPESAHFAPLTLEWSDETHRFSVAAQLAGHQALARRATRRSG